MSGPPGPVPDPAGGEAQSADHNTCGARSAAAWVRAFGGDPSGLSIPDGATAWQIRDGINALGQGFHADVLYPADPMLVAQTQIPLGHGLVIGVYCTPDAQPTIVANATANHWLDLYDTTGWCFNCWEQTFQHYDNLSQCHNPQMGTVVIWRDPQPSPPPQGDDEMRVRGPFFWAAKNEQHWFQLAGDGTLWHKWLPLSGPTAGKQGNQIIGVAGEFNPAAGFDYAYFGGQLHLTLEDAKGLLHNIYQGDAEGVWHDAILA